MGKKERAAAAVYRELVRKYYFALKDRRGLGRIDWAVEEHRGRSVDGLKESVVSGRKKE